ncbi:hypothetical protein ACJIZ3_006343 [Penstemon smallii]|uniref:X8 domain-containing protein n=1 Tax=Penstemon smallii TaxID=265156 RepID=A0ABD3S7W1_9LAMI
MAKQHALLFLLSYLLILVHVHHGNSTLVGEKQVKQWCVTRTDAPTEQLEDFLDEACLKIDCRPIQYGGACYFPDVIGFLASYVLNKFYQITHVCGSDISILTSMNPPSGKCKYT